MYENSLAHSEQLMSFFLLYKYKNIKENDAFKMLR